MSYTIFHSDPTTLIPQPGRAVNTFPSGLVRVDQTYIGLTSEYAAHRATLAVGNDMPDGDSSPCIDGLKIFPEVQERRREDGFTEYIVSAYGRANTTGSTVRPIITSTDFGGYSYRSFIYKATLPTSSLSLPAPPPPVEPDYVFVSEDVRTVPSTINKLKAPGKVFLLSSTKKTYLYRSSSITVNVLVWPESFSLGSSAFENFGDFDECVFPYTAPLFQLGGSIGFVPEDAETYYDDTLVGTVADLFA